MALEQHARGAGCRLIIDPELDFPHLTESAVAARLKTLLAFLQSVPDRKCEVAWNQSVVYNDSVTMVGNWFAAEAVRAKRGTGYLQTVFTRHAPTLMSKIEAFDEEFAGLLDLHGWTRKGSRRAAIRLIQRRIQALRA